MSINTIDTEQREGLREGLAMDKAIYTMEDDMHDFVDGGTEGMASKSDYDLVKENLIFCPWGGASPYDIADYLQLDEDDAKLLSKDEYIRENWDEALHEEMYLYGTTSFPTDPDERWEKMMRLQFGLL